MTRRHRAARRRSTRAAAPLAALAAAAIWVGALALPGVGGGAGPASVASLTQTTAPEYRVVRVGAGELRPATEAEVARLGVADARARREPFEVSYYIGADSLTVDPGGAQLFEIRCPSGAELPLAGGTFAPIPGLVIVNSSRSNPTATAPTRPRAWYEAVVNIMATPLQWKPFVTCASSRRAKR